MNVIAKREILKAAEKFGVVEEATAWYRKVKSAKWTSLVDVRASFASADRVGDLLLFDICHNRYRMIVRVDFANNVMFFLGIVTHKEYDRGEWRNWK